MTSPQARKRVGRYSLIEELGRGQFGTVHKATRADLPLSLFALKCLPKESIERHPYYTRLFKTEIEVMQKVSHPNVMKLHETIETMNNYYLVLSYCDGGDLEGLVTKEGPLPEPRALHFLRQIGSGFSALVDLKVMHRDFKLANVFLHQGDAVIGDFGFARMGLESTSTQLGTPASMAPEMLLAADNEPYGNKADLWSIGVALYQMLFGQTPFGSRSMYDLKKRVLTDSGVNLKFPAGEGQPRVSPAMRALLTSLIEPDPVRRIEWAAFFGHPLVRWDAGRGEGRSRSLTPAASPRASHGEADIRRVESLLMHEKRKGDFCMFAARTVRNVSKEPWAAGEVSQRLVLLSVLLAKRGWLGNQRCLSAIRRGQNLLCIPRFDQFWASQGLIRVLAFFGEDAQVFETFLNRVQLRAIEEIKLASVAALLNQSLSLGQTDLVEIESLVRAQLGLLNGFLLPLPDPLALAMLHCYYAVGGDKALTPDDEGNFDWKKFRESLTPITAQKVFANF